MTQQELAQYLKPFIDAAANGNHVEIKTTYGTWEEALTFSDLSEYRIEQKTITVNGFEVPEPMRDEPELDTGYFAPNVVSTDMYSYSRWDDCSIDKTRLSRGICHKTKEAAIAHAKAMLGIDPIPNIEIRGNDCSDSHTGGGFITRCVLSGTKDGE